MGSNEQGAQWAGKGKGKAAPGSAVSQALSKVGTFGAKAPPGDQPEGDEPAVGKAVSKAASKSSLMGSLLASVGKASAKAPSEAPSPKAATSALSPEEAAQKGVSAIKTELSNSGGTSSISKLSVAVGWGKEDLEGLGNLLAFLKKHPEDFNMKGATVSLATAADAEET